MRNFQSIGLVSILVTSTMCAAPAFCDSDDEVQPPSLQAPSGAQSLAAPIGAQSLSAPTKPLAGHITVEDSREGAPSNSAAPTAKKTPPVKLTPIAMPVPAPVPPPKVHKATVAQTEQPIDLHKLPLGLRHRSPDDRAARMAMFFRMQAMQAQMGAAQRPLTAQVSQAQDPDIVNLNAPYVWSQNFAGGYIDTSGHCKEAVWGDKLVNYGGKFWDGTPVLKGPVALNSRGHIWWQKNLNPQYFVRRETTNL
jgi:hypothetical protein